MKIINIAFIDDSFMCRELFKLVLKNSKEFSFEIVFEADTLVGIEKYKELGEKLDFILLDIMLPDIDGVSGISIVKELFPLTSIIMVSDISDLDVQQKCLALGASAYVTKSKTSSSLIEAIKSLIL